MKNYLVLSFLAAMALGCSSSNKEQKEKLSDSQAAAENNKESTTNNAEEKKGDTYKLVIRQIDNRAVVYINDSTIYDSNTVNGVVNVEIDLTDYVKAEKTDLKVELYNGAPPYNTASPSWKIIYDIFVNDELADFVREESEDGRVGLVHTETHDLSDIW